MRFQIILKRADVILIIALLALSALLFAVFYSGEEGALAVVAVDGETVAEYPLAVNGEFELNGGTNILVIENGKAYLRDADCPDKLCVKQGKISKTGQCITCLPNRLTVTITGAGENEVDFVVG